MKFEKLFCKNTFLQKFILLKDFFIKKYFNNCQKIKNHPILTNKMIHKMKKNI